MHFMKEKKIKNILKQCQVIAENSYCLRRKFGAIITTPEGVHISGGYNGSVRGAKNCGEDGVCGKDHHDAPHDTAYEVCGAVHAEVNAILNVARSGSGIPLKEAILFLNSAKDGHAGRPCRNCRRNIINAGIRYVYFYNKNGSLSSIDTNTWVGEETRWLKEGRFAS